MSRKVKQLSREDRVLWGQVARSVDAYPGRMEALESLQAESQTPFSEPNHRISPPSSPKVVPQDQPKKPARAPGREPGVAPIEKPTYRKLARGRLPLEASIDLHGLTQSEAYGLLHGFIARAHARGLRHVLVVTGKGTSSGGDGVLRRAVPHWLRTPEFRGMASGCQPAARGHGGDGAFYVRLRRPNH